MLMKESKNLTCLADGYVFPTSQSETGINPNELIVGPTRSGKTMSVVEPKLLHTFDNSVVISITKRALYEKYADLFRARGYAVWDLNLADPTSSNVAYDPLDFVKTDRDIMALTHMLVGGEMSRTIEGTADPYWNQSAESGLAAIFHLVVDEAARQGKNPSFTDFYKLYRKLSISTEGNVATTTLDKMFDRLEERKPDSVAPRLWNTIRGNAPRTASCIYSVMNNAVDKLFSPEILKMTSKMRKHVSFEELGSRKVALFITTSPVNKSLQKMCTMFFTDAFRELFEYAESLPARELPVPVHLICDDFATGSVIPDFDEYISVFCAKGISCSLLLQSESQLQSMYGANAATTIINNCDTYLYMGGMDYTTCANVSRRKNIPLEDVYSLPLERVILFRRGSRAVEAKRYQTLKDPLYLSLMNKNNNQNEKEVLTNNQENDKV